MSKFDVQKVARLARLRVEPNEIPALERDLEAILAYVRDLESLKLDDVPPTSHANALHAPMRPDQPQPSLDLDRVLANAPEKEGSAFKVPKVIE